MNRSIPTNEEMDKALMDRYGAVLQRKVKESKVVICGLGGLGSNIALALVRAGVSKLHLIDFDKVDVSNLNRQQYKAKQIGRYKTEALRENLLEVSPYCDIKIDTIKINEDNIYELIDDADIVCEAFDVAEQKAMLVNSVLEKFPDKYIVSGIGMAGIESANSINTKKVGERLYICGDGKSDVTTGIGLVAPRVMVCAAHQAHMVIRIIGEMYDA